MKKLFGNKAFYAMVLAIAIPIIIQNGITNFVGLLDNIMIGQMGTIQISSVSIVNQLLNVFNITIFGAMSGPSIFSAQYAGNEDNEGIQHCFRYKVYIGMFIFIVAVLIFLGFQNQLMLLFLSTKTNTAADIAEVLKYGKIYLNIMLLGLGPFMLVQVYSSTLRENKETKLPMKASTAAVVINFVLNYLLIFGKFGFPALGVTGAAIATVISRFAELLIIVVGAHKDKTQKYLEGIYTTFSIPLQLTKQISIKSAPLLANEILWSTGMAVLTQCYSLFGIEAVAAVNICMTVSNFFMIVCYAMGNVTSIIVGQKLGQGAREDAIDTSIRLTVMDALLCVVIGILLICTSRIIPEAYNTTQTVKELSVILLIIYAAHMPITALYMSAYFTIRSGGNSILTFLMDCCYTWAVNIVLAFILTRFTTLSLIPVYLIVTMADIPKSIFGVYLVAKGTWAQNLIA